MMIDLVYARDRMINVHLKRRGISDPNVIKAMKTVPRENFVAEGYEDTAYEDTALAIGQGQTISQPFIVALMIASANIKPDDNVLEIGTGSGYAAAVLSRIAGHIYTIERLGELANVAKQRFAALGYDNIEVRTGDGTKGWPDAKLFDAILVTAASSEIPRALKAQLNVKGRMIIPIGSKNEQHLLQLTRVDATTFEEKDLGGVRFVPLLHNSLRDDL